MANRFWEFVGRFIPGTTVRAEPVNDKFDGIESGFEAIEGELDRSIRLPNTYTGTRSLPEVDPRECLLYINASNQLALYGMASFTASVNDVAIKHADVVVRHNDIIARHNNIISRHADITTKHDYVASVANSPAVGALLPLTPVANGLPYYTSGSAAALATISAFGRSLIDDADAATARATLGAQAADATLTALAGATTAANKLAYFSGVDAVAMADLTPFARTLLDDASAAEARTTLGLGTAATATVTTSATDTAAGRLLKVGDWGLGSLQLDVSDLISDASVNRARFFRQLGSAVGGCGFLSGCASFPIDGAPSTGFIAVSHVSGVRAAVGVKVGATGTPVWAELITHANVPLAALSELTPAANKVPYFTGTNAAALFNIESFARTWLGNASSAASARSGMRAYGGILVSHWAGSHVVANSPSTSHIALSSFPNDGVLHIQYLYGTQYGSFALPYSKNGSFEQRFAIGAGYVSIMEITSTLIRFQATDISGSVTITQIWAQL
jgi:hypothetical protein